MDETLILLIEDEVPIRQMLRFSLERERFKVSEASNAPAARVAIADRRPDLVLLDWMLPGVSGSELARELKSAPETGDLPIIMVTARTGEEDRVYGLDLGCDDYVAKPFSMLELIARIRAVLRRTRPGGSQERLQIEGLVVDGASKRVSADDSRVTLGPTEYRLLEFLAGHPERAYTREQLLNRVWGHNVYVEHRTVDVHIGRLRKALAPHGYDRFIQTVRGSGYRFSTET